MLNKQNKRGFTMVELIVVVLVLLILGIISYLSVSKYTKTSRDASRLADIQSLRKSLELFSIKTGKYPLPDDSIELSYSGELLWSQGVVGDNVFTNISENLNKKPVDPLLETEYVYSITNIRNEYEIMGLYEQQLSFDNSNLILEGANAIDNYYIQIEGTYNRLYITTPSFLFATPSIINGAVLTDTDFYNEPTLIKSQVITGEDNVPDLGDSLVKSVTGSLDMEVVVGNAVSKDSSIEEKIAAIDVLQESYLGTSIENAELYNLVLTSSTSAEKLELANRIFGSNFTGEMILDMSCVIDGKIIPTGEVAKLYSENVIDKLETYDCEEVSQIRFCEDTVLDGEEFYQYSSCIKGEATNCISKSYTYNEHNYILPSLDHGQTLGDLELEEGILSQQINENHGIFMYQLTDSLNCNDGSYIDFNEEAAILVLCDSGYIEIGNECIFAGEIEITSGESLVCPLCEE